MSQPRRARQRLAVMVRTPTPGQVKTRLIPALGAEHAAALQRAFSLDLVERLGEGDWQLLVYETPAPGDWLELPGVEIRAQACGDLGERMAEVFRQAEREAVERTLIIGSDSPDLPRQRVEQAFEALRQHPLVLVPATDGGYALIGACSVPWQLLHAMPWGEATLLTRTVERIRHSGLASQLLEPWYDVDRPEDLALLAVQLGHAARSGVELAPRSRRLLVELGYAAAAS